MPKIDVQSPTEEVVAKVNRLGLTKAARAFKTSPSSLSRWLRAQGYKSKCQYVKENQNTHQYQTA